MHPSRSAALLASTWLLAAAAPTLTATMPDTVANDLTRRTLSAANRSGLADAETLGAPYVLSRGPTILGVLVSGRFTQATPHEHTTCFITLIKPGSARVTLLPTIGAGRWPTQTCHGYTALGLLPSPPGTIRLGILYDQDASPTPTPVILTWPDHQPPALDLPATTTCATHHPTTIADMRRPIAAPHPHWKKPSPPLPICKHPVAKTATAPTKVFCFFSSEKKALPAHLTPHPARRLKDDPPNTRDRSAISHPRFCHCEQRAPPARDLSHQAPNAAPTTRPHCSAHSAWQRDRQTETRRSP